jgi:hypothetical protein
MLRTSIGKNRNLSHSAMVMNWVFIVNFFGYKSTDCSCCCSVLEFATVGLHSVSTPYFYSNVVELIVNEDRAKICLFLVHCKSK